MLINAAIDKAKKGSYLHGLPHVADPSKEVQEVLIACMEWNMDTHARNIPESDLQALQQKAVDLLDLLHLKTSLNTSGTYVYTLIHPIMYLYVQVHTCTY